MYQNGLNFWLGLPQLRVLWLRDSGDSLEIVVIYRREVVPCPRCQQSASREHDRKAQRKYHQAGNKKMTLVLMKRRFRCLYCGKVFTEPDEIFGARRRCSRHFREFLRQQASGHSTKSVAKEIGVSESLVRRSLRESPIPSLAAGVR